MLILIQYSAFFVLDCGILISGNLGTFPGDQNSE